MASPKPRQPSSPIVLAVLLFSALSFRPGSASGSQEAYVTLLYGDEFLLGVRVLGKSIRGTGATKDMVALVSDGVSDYAKDLLKVGFLLIQSLGVLVSYAVFC